MSILHFYGERKQKGEAPGVHHYLTLEVRTRVAIDAIVSNKTFANATIPVTGQSIFVLTNCRNTEHAEIGFEIFKKSADTHFGTLIRCKRTSPFARRHFWRNFIL
jgi:hypothetical protein